jgi:tetratricopeptide (TPR) repeat protein
MNKIFLVEDHDEVLNIWRNKKVAGLDLVHIDAHMDFGFHPAKPLKQALDEARSVKELIKGLEHSIAFTRYEKDFNKQTNIGNYIYPAMAEGLVNNFYWIVPGRLKEFNKSAGFIRNILRNLIAESGEKAGPARHRPMNAKAGVISAEIMGKDFIICPLDRLPVLKHKVLLDIDTDFLVIDSLLNAGNTQQVGKRKSWIQPRELAAVLREKIKNPQITTIAYSVNGGYTPMKYKHLGDQLACHFAPREFRSRFENNHQASQYFRLFSSTGKKEYYRKAVKLNPAYRAADNNYGPLYLALRKFTLAGREFLRVLRADPGNPACLAGLGHVALERNDLRTAKRYFSSASNPKNNRLFKKEKRQSLLGLAEAEFGLKNFGRAKDLLSRYQKFEPLQPRSYYFSGRIHETENDFERAAERYKDAIRLGFGGLAPMTRLLKISCHLKEKDAIINYLIGKYKELKKGFIRAKKLSLKKRKKVIGLRKTEKKLAVFEERLHKVSVLRNLE